MALQDRASLSDDELHAFFDRLFPDGFAGPDVLAEIAPEGWERSPLFACFHPAVEQTLAKMRRKYRPQPVRQYDEITDLMGMCLWDVFSDNHQVTAADGRVVDLGSWRCSSAFLDGWLCDRRNSFREGDDMRFYMGSAWIGDRADLAPVYRLIFRRLRTLGSDWRYTFPELYLVEFSKPADSSGAGYSVSKGARDTLEAQRRARELDEWRKQLAGIHAQERDDAMDRLPPATVRAYQDVFGRNPRGWPPA